MPLTVHVRYVVGGYKDASGAMWEHGMGRERMRKRGSGVTKQQADANTDGHSDKVGFLFFFF